MHNDLELGGFGPRARPVAGRRPGERATRRPHGFQPAPLRAQAAGGRPETTLGRVVTTRTDVRRTSGTPR